MIGVLKFMAALVAVWILSGCAAMRLAYDNADTWLRWRASSYLNITAEDSEELDERIDAFHAWHRSTALPQYARLAEEAAKRVGRGLTREDLVWGYDSVVAQARESLRAGVERFGPYLDRVGPSQVEPLQRGFAEDNRKFARENIRGSEDERRKRRAKRTAERLEDWVGKLSQAQLQRVREYSERAPLYDELRDRDRKRLQAELIEIVRTKSAQKRLAERMVNWQQGRDPAYQAANDTWREHYFAMLVDIDKTLTPEQRARAVARFRGFAEDFAILATRAAGEAAAKPQ